MISVGGYFVAASSITRSFRDSRLQLVYAMTAQGNRPVVDAIVIGAMNSRVLHSLLFVCSALQREHDFSPPCFSICIFWVVSVCACVRLISLRRVLLLFSEFQGASRYAPLMSVS